MKRIDIPPKFQIPFGNSAGGAFITYPLPQPSQIGVTPGRASLTDGFPPLNMTEIGAGGVPPFGQDINGIMKQITLWSRWQGAGAPVQYDAAFSGAIGGYPKGTMLLSNASTLFFWISTVDDNTSNPDAGGAGWTPLFEAASLQSGGYLSLSGSPTFPVLNVDATSTQVFWYPKDTGILPHWNGAAFVPRTPGPLTLNLNAAFHLASTIYDVYSVNDGGGGIVLGTSPQWTTSTPGGGSRGATVNLMRSANGFLVNAAPFAVRNGVNAYAVGVGEGYYLGSIMIDAVAGQVTCHVTYGQARKWGVWNAYNREPIILQGGDPTGNWTYAGGAIRPSNGNADNYVSFFAGLPDEFVYIDFSQNNVAPTGASPINYIGINSTSASSGLGGITDNPLGTQVAWQATAKCVVQPSVGVNRAQMLEASNGVGSFFRGSSPYMLMTARYNG